MASAFKSPSGSLTPNFTGGGRHLHTMEDPLALQVLLSVLQDLRQRKGETASDDDPAIPPDPSAPGSPGAYELNKEQYIQDLAQDRADHLHDAHSIARAIGGLIPFLIILLFVQCLHNPRSSSVEDLFNGPWIAVLSHFFPLAEGFTVCAQAVNRLDPLFHKREHESARKRVDFAVGYIVARGPCPVLLLEIKPAASQLSSILRRAFTQIVERFVSYNKVVPFEEFFVISAFGTKFAIFTNTYSRELLPAAIVPVGLPESVSKTGVWTTTISEILESDFAMSSQPWSWDLLTPEGSAKFVEIVNKVKHTVNSTLKPSEDAFALYEVRGRRWEKEFQKRLAVLTPKSAQKARSPARTPTTADTLHPHSVSPSGRPVRTPKTSPPPQHRQTDSSDSMSVDEETEKKKDPDYKPPRSR